MLHELFDDGINSAKKRKSDKPKKHLGSTVETIVPKKPKNLFMNCLKIHTPSPPTNKADEYEFNDDDDLDDLPAIGKHRPKPEVKKPEVVAPPATPPPPPPPPATAPPPEPVHRAVSPVKVEAKPKPKPIKDVVNAESPKKSQKGFKGHICPSSRTAALVET